MPRAASPPGGPEGQPPEGQPPEGQASAASRLLQAQAAELAALRRRVAGAPEPDELEVLRAKASRFDALSQQLPQWQEQVKGLFEQQQGQLQSQIAAERQELQQQRLQSALATTFVAAGGLPEWAATFAEMQGKGAAFDDAGQLLLSGPDGAPLPAAEALDRLRTHAQWAYVFKPLYGRGSGATSSQAPQFPGGSDLSRMTTAQKFDVAFTRGGQ